MRRGTCTTQAAERVRGDVQLPAQQPGQHGRPPTASGDYSVALLADQNFTASVSAYSRATPDWTSPCRSARWTQPDLQPGPAHRQASRLGPGRQRQPDHRRQGRSSATAISPLPGLPGTPASTSTATATALDANGNVTISVPNGVTLNNTEIVLNNGLAIPFTLHPITGDRHAFIIFNRRRDGHRG